MFYQVIQREQMISSISTLMALCEKAENDIRTCLNTLQVCTYIVQKGHEIFIFCVVHKS